MDFLLNFDLFPSSSFLQYRSRKKVGSCPGFLVSILVYLFLFYTLMNSDMVQKKNPKTNDRTVAQTDYWKSIDKPNLNVKPIINITDTQNNNSYTYFDPTIWKLEVLAGNYSISFENCSTTYQNQMYYGSLCIPNNTILNIDYSISVEIKVSICQNSSKNNYFCRSNDEIMSFVKSKIFDMSYLDISFDLDDYDNPVKSSRYSLIATKLNPQISVLYNFDLLVVEFKSSKNLFYQEDVSEFYYTSEYTKGNNFQFELKTDQSNFDLLAVMIQLSHSKRVVNRKYQEITEVLGNLGGLLSIIKIFGSILLSIFPQLKLIKDFSNKLCSISNCNDNDKNPKKTIFFELAIKNSNLNENIMKNDEIVEEAYLRDPNLSIFPNNNNNLSAYLRKDQGCDNNDIIKNENKILQSPKTDDKSLFEDKTNEKSNDDIDILLKTIKKLKQSINEKNKKKFDFSFFSYFKNKFKSFFRFPLDFEGKNILNSEEIYQKETDIINLLKRLQDVEKLKYFLFTKDQRILFELIKPFLDEDCNINQEKMVLSERFSGKKENQSKNSIFEILNEYEEKIKNEHKINKIDRRMILFFK